MLLVLLALLVLLLLAVLEALLAEKGVAPLGMTDLDVWKYLDHLLTGVSCPIVSWWQVLWNFVSW